MWASQYLARSPPAVGLFIRFLFIGSRLCSTLLSDPASRRRPCVSLSLHLHQVVKRTFTSKLSNMLGTLKKALASLRGLLVRSVQLNRITFRGSRRARRRLPELSCLPERRRPELRWSASEQRWKPRSAGRCGSP